MIETTVTSKVVWIDVQLYPAAKKVEVSRRAQREMDQLQNEFLRWKLDNRIECAGRGSSGPLGFSGAYAVKDAKKVIAWLRARGLKVNA